ncbi:hypothetical protein F7230_05165 [Corynebacterium sp. 320]|uniref:hypothetical protein n=1 Tax=Corynebacterium TaxID=1716 RepID=UPI00125CCADE|nr:MULTISPECIES: hypothetical protein [Corynebacterium]KAB1504454.1 hypothetical protein F7230_05165 [Corynebacterium sp. 320]KAB1552447.1 hypothetical protein F7233_01435 [Corynebacterium sp. 321]KAB1554338.1 hypothetical protein F7232_05165 [Corynebacterium sp. 319]KAB3528590.1 hypothetical protein F8354_05165 [Corynebacterium sp. 250]KAB3539918.1 hypothetical protein F8390_01165 [Corynebacterium sp. 366]
MTHTYTHTDVPVVLYATAEATDTHYLHEVTGLPVVRSARELSAIVHDRVCVVPMCTGRDLTSITHAAQALRWLTERTSLRAALATPVCTSTYVIARMRHHLRRLAPTHDAVVFLAAAVDPFADAELCRRVRLAQQFSESTEVALAFDDPGQRGADCWPTLPEVTSRLHKIMDGQPTVAVVRADFHAPRAESCEAHALMPGSALKTAVLASVKKALHAQEHGDDGIAAGLLADHDQGFAHSHGDEDHAHGHAHSHAHAHAHGHAHSHSHSHH